MFDEVFTTYPTLLMLMNREEEAIQMLEESIKICKYLDLKDANGKVLLMLTSIDIKNNMTFNIKNNLIEC